MNPDLGKQRSRDHSTHANLRYQEALDPAQIIERTKGRCNIPFISPRSFDQAVMMHSNTFRLTLSLRVTFWIGEVDGLLAVD